MNILSGEAELPLSFFKVKICLRRGNFLPLGADDCMLEGLSQV